MITSRRDTRSTAPVKIRYEGPVTALTVRFDPEALATRAMRLSEEDKDAFVRKLQDLGAETGFVDA